MQYVLGVHNSVVRTVYRPVDWRLREEGDRGWEHDQGKPTRWGFDGQPAPEMAPFLRTSVRRFLKARQWSFVYAGSEDS